MSTVYTKILNNIYLKLVISFLLWYNVYMVVDLSTLVNSNLTVGVAFSGGGDSMALLHYLHTASKTNNFKVIAINVEHGIRGEASIRDTEFVKDYCYKNDIELICYSVDCVTKSKEEKISIEQAARILRYECFFSAIKSGKCDKVATAHHSSDNAESVLLNLLRGSGLKGLIGIKARRSDGIIRPLIKCDKSQIEQYLKENNLPFVTDETNLCDDYTRNFLRLNVLPKIKEVFPEAEKSIGRLSEIAELEDEYLDQQADHALTRNQEYIKLSTPCHVAVFNRAVIKALKELGLEKDWEKTHVDEVFNLSLGLNGNRINLPNQIIAIKEYDGVVFFKQTENSFYPVPFMPGKIDFFNTTLTITRIENGVDLKTGYYADLDKIPKGALIRVRKEGDVFKKFGGGTKSLSDFFTDKKVPRRIRSQIPLIAYNNEILAIFGMAISDKIKVDDNTKAIVKLDIKD